MQVLRVITAVFLRETLEAANNDAELMVMERLRQKGKYIKRLEGSMAHLYLLLMPCSIISCLRSRHLPGYG